MNEWIILENTSQYFSRYRLSSFVPSVLSKSPSAGIPAESDLRRYVVIQKFIFDPTDGFQHHSISMSGIKTNYWKCEEYTLSKEEFDKLLQSGVYK